MIAGVMIGTYVTLEKKRRNNMNLLNQSENNYYYNSIAWLGQPLRAQVY